LRLQSLSLREGVVIASSCKLHGAAGDLLREVEAHFFLHLLGRGETHQLGLELLDLHEPRVELGTLAEQRIGGC
jgi:hypothetical protein